MIAKGMSNSSVDKRPSENESNAASVHRASPSTTHALTKHGSSDGEPILGPMPSRTPDPPTQESTGHVTLTLGAPLGIEQRYAGRT